MGAAMGGAVMSSATAGATSGGDTASGVSGGTTGTSGTSALGGAGTSGNGGGTAGQSTLANCKSNNYNGHSYQMCGDKTGWLDAKANCESVGMQLARVDDLAENQWLGANAYDPNGGTTGLWIGASDAAVDGEWRWTDGTLFWLGAPSSGAAQNGLFTDWDGSYHGSNKSYNCVYLALQRTPSFGWCNQACGSNLLIYACESL
jgi:hypothetical protein